MSRAQYPYPFPWAEHNLHFVEKTINVFTFMTLINQIILTF
jgi:hypothetical protein